jgi:hypothetical protein
MDMHWNAGLTPCGREATACAAVDQGLTRAEAARRFNTLTKTVRKWVGRFSAGRFAACADDPYIRFPLQARMRPPPAVEALRCTGVKVARIVTERKVTIAGLPSTHGGWALVTEISPDVDADQPVRRQMAIILLR